MSKLFFLDKIYWKLTWIEFKDSYKQLYEPFEMEYERPRRQFGLWLMSMIGLFFVIMTFIINSGWNIFVFGLVLFVGSTTARIIDARLSDKKEEVKYE